MTKHTSTEQLTARAAKREAKMLDEFISNVFKKNASGVQFDMMDLSKIMDAGKAAKTSVGTPWEDVENAVIAAIRQYRKN